MIDVICHVRAEAIKLWSLRSIKAAGLVYVMLSVGLGLLFGAGARQALDTDDPLLREDFTPELAGLESVGVGVLAIVVLGVLAATIEYGTGMHRLSLLAQPVRTRFLAAKAVTVVLFVLVVAVPTVPLTYVLAQKAMGPYGSTLGAPSVPLAVGGAVVALSLMALVAFALAVIFRSNVVPLAILLPMIFAGSQILSAIDATRAAAKYLPDRAASAIYRIDPAAGELDSLAGLAVLVAWVVGLLLVAAVLTERRPA